MGDVTKPPSRIYCLGYSYSKDRMSGANQELFLLDFDVIRRIDELQRLYPGGKLTNLTVHELLPDDEPVPHLLVWVPRVVRYATGTKILTIEEAL
jgi:hypothetical protein